MAWSASWTPELFGNVQGHVRTGFARGWVTPLGPLQRAGESILDLSGDGSLNWGRVNTGFARGWVTQLGPSQRTGELILNK